MLKKLVKYGNSNALVLDKALLQLLNIEEGSLVKIKTDGVSLIISPKDAATQDEVAKTIVPQEVLKDAVMQNLETSFKNTEDTESYLSEVHAVIAKNVKSIEELDPFQRAEINKKAHEVYQKYATNAASSPANISRAMAEFKKVHEKYAHLHKQIAELNEQADYINESVLLAEKYQETKNSPEYFEECTQLIAQSIPEYADYQNELKAVSATLGESVNK